MTPAPDCFDQLTRAGHARWLCGNTGAPPKPNHDGPAQFLPTPSGLVTSGGLPCDSANNAYAASWITGVTRDAARPWDNADSYRWYAGPSSWTASPGSAASVIAGARPLSVTVNNFSALGHGLVPIEQTNIVGGFTVYRRPARPERGGRRRQEQCRAPSNATASAARSSVIPS